MLCFPGVQQAYVNVPHHVQGQAVQSYTNVFGRLTCYAEVSVAGAAQTINQPGAVAGASQSSCWACAGG
jgi:hypothetical protein